MANTHTRDPWTVPWRHLLLEGPWSFTQDLELTVCELLLMSWYVYCLWLLIYFILFSSKSCKWEYMLLRVCIHCCGGTLQEGAFRDMWDSGNSGFVGLADDVDILEWDPEVGEIVWLLSWLLKCSSSQEFTSLLWCLNIFLIIWSKSFDSHPVQMLVHAGCIHSVLWGNVHMALIPWFMKLGCWISADSQVHISRCK